VKNNLQIVISLLNTQSSYLNNNAALDAIRESQHRMYSMSLIHQKLYQAENVSSIDMNNYICDLVGYLKQSFDTGNKINFNLALKQISLDVVQAVPLGLILNEVITNSIKYAFPGDMRGNISIFLHPIDSEIFALTIKDDGVGLPEDFSLPTCKSLGMNLVSGLSKQLGAQLDISGEGGLTIRLLVTRKKMFIKEFLNTEKETII
jgi:two-component sensor histidine kinase